MLDLSDFSLIIFFISILFYLFVSFKVALTILVLALSSLYGAQVVFDFKSKPVKTANRQSKFSQKSKDKQKGGEDRRIYQRTSVGRFLNFFNFNEETNMNNSISLGRKTSFRTKSPKRNAVGRSHSFSVSSSSSNVLQKQKINQNQRFMSTTGPLLTLPFLPRVKRALGLDSDSSPRKTVTQPVPAYTTHPTTSSPGFLPAVRLGRREKFNLSANSSVIRSPNTVKIAPPEPHRLSSPRLLEVRNNSQNSELRRTPDTQAVVSALKEKSKKRTIATNEDTYTEYPIHQAKRRRQESQQSNASTSSLPPLPANLPDLSTSGYTIPRLETPTLKRTADLSEHEWEENIAAAKRLRKENRNNSIISSLSSMKRVELKEGEALVRQNKRKVRHEEKENFTEMKKLAKADKASTDYTSIGLDRSDTVILPPDFDQSIGNHSQSVNESTSNISDTSSILDKSQTDPKLQKRVSLNETFSARKREMSFYSGLNKSFKKVPQANVLASMEDYESDREAEQQRVQEMLEGIKEAEKEQEQKNEKSKVQAVSSSVSSTITTTGSSQSFTSIASVALTSTTTPSSLATPISLNSTASSTSTPTPATIAQTKYTFKPAFGDVSASVTTTTSATPFSGFSLSQGTGVTTTSAIPPVSSNNESSGLKFNFATVKSSETTISSTTATNTGLGPLPSSVLTSNTSTTTSTSTMPSIPGFGANAPLGFNFGNTAATAGSGTGILQSTLGVNANTPTRSSAGAPSVNNSLQPGGASVFGMASAGSTTTTTSSLGSTLTSLGQNTNTSFGTGILGSNVNSFGVNNTTPGLNFGTSSATTNVVSGFTFGSTTSANTGSTLGSVPTSVTSGFGTSLFGQRPPPPAYGAQSSIASSQPFAAPQSASGSAAFNFVGVNSTNTPASQSVFGSQGQSTAAKSTGMFGSTGQTTTASSVFGAQGQVTSAPSLFGSTGQASTSSIFGSQGQASAVPPIFGSTGQTGAASSVFGSTVQSTTSNSNSFNFGASSGQSSSFQNSSNTQTNKTSSMFGGQTANQTSNFNTTPVTKSSVFGNIQQPSSFGGTSAFGQEKSTSFSANPSTTQSGFAFGSSTASFGVAQTTQKTGFGATNSTTTSGNTAGSNTFTFGTSTPVKSGFDFSSSASGGGSTSGFSFNANINFGTPGGTNQAPNFGTPTPGSNQAAGFGTPTAGGLPTPNFGTPTNNMFSIGASNTSARPRVTAKPKRRSTTGRR